MTASDKLRNLQGAASKERTQEELFAAFPQLLAVVEAAENVAECEDALTEDGYAYLVPRDALSALDKALS